MKFAATSVVLALAAGFASAQLADVPKCAAGCVQEYTIGTNIGNCPQLDIECICKNTQFIDGIACCLDKSCDEAGKKEAVAYAKQICSTKNVKLPDEVVCKAGSGSSSSSAAASDSTASKTSATSSTATQSAASQTSSGAAAGGLAPFSGSIGAGLALLLAL